MELKTVLEILDGCAKNGVVDFSLGDLKISFVPKPPEPRVFIREAGAEPQDSKEVAENKRNLSREDRLAQLMVEDPLGFEQEMMAPLSEDN